MIRTIRKYVLAGQPSLWRFFRLWKRASQVMTEICCPLLPPTFHCPLFLMLKNYLHVCSCHFRQALKHKSKFEIQLDLKEPNHESAQKKLGGSCFATRYHAESCCYYLKGSNKPTSVCMANLDKVDSHLGD